MRLKIKAALLLIALPVFMFAQQGNGQRPDPKMMSAKMAEKLNFTDEQNAQLKELNAKYTGDNYDKQSYREAFRQIMTDEQKQKAMEMRKERESHRGGNAKRMNK